jgi:ABC-2 type transport system ATP-binding protein
MSAPLLVHDLWKSYGGNAAVRGLGFDVRAGEIFGLLGVNGAGKTTTVECVLGLREPDRGTIEVCGIDARREPREAKRQLGAALQGTGLPDKITPREALALFGALYPGSRAMPPDAATALLARFGLTEKADAFFETLSGGQRQKLALALAFVHRPQVLLLDEPTAGLDAHARRDLHGEIARLKADGCAILLTTHDLDEAARLCDRVAILHCGAIVATGAPRELVVQHGKTSLEELFLALTGGEPAR